ncbi:MAG: hypothetical protein UY06_C0012G0010 [Candidatus Amesbacteria bacterium GW2011_GWA2_47_70]|uniref:Dockerin domain-containing protein n=1 Tax=Candidatus Amesbacteria bacterium GW2011_GWC2_45_19 TaxID=1618366 RepID=A0A0G1M1V2_9BACT|nr:MAG: hypothetical protein UX05_C0015G0007 [Candidatus Amesbacteria bacterium GW2011_GWC2_45_19]KKU68172.1 MAG: hypothetical protein UX93_C0010G0027 [Microgenomates group bacterium GW2011_GWC1_47_20]KKU79839.1 MAG: hypothetical protein UY06_C0012G0010 [Candidatus Amesbacteria bacterium GW2011_GWA2_47_70]
MASLGVYNQMMNIKEKLDSKLIALLVLVAVLPVLVWGTMQVRRWLGRAAGPTVGLAFSPGSETLPPDKNLGIVVEAGTEKISGAHVEFTFDRTKVQLAGEVQVTGALTQVLIKTTASEANSTGRVKLAVGMPLGQAGQGPSGNVELARVTFRSVTTANTTASVNYDSSKVEIVNDAATKLAVNPRGATLTLNSGGGTGARVFSSPASATLPPNKTLGIMVDSGVEKVGFAQVEFTFNTAKVRLASEVQITGPLTTVLAKTTRAQANSTGRVRIALGLPLVQLPNPTPVPPSGSFEIARVTLTSASSTNNDSAGLDFDTGQLQVVTVGERVLSVLATGTALSLNPVASTPTPTPRPTPTPTPTPRPTPTPTPRPTPTPTPTPRPTPTPTPRPTPTPTPAPTPTPTGTETSFFFKVRLQGITTKANDQLSVIKFSRNGQVVSNLASATLINDSSGVYSGGNFFVSVATGDYDICIKTQSHLQRCIRNVRLDQGVPLIQDWSTLANESKQLLVGDVNGTNTITIEDVAAVLAKYTDFVVPVPAGTPEDVNADNRITIDDVALTLINYTDFTVDGDR